MILDVAFVTSVTILSFPGALLICNLFDCLIYFTDDISFLSL